MGLWGWQGENEYACVQSFTMRAIVSSLQADAFGLASDPRAADVLAKIVELKAAAK